MKNILLAVAFALGLTQAFAQTPTNIIVTNSAAEQVMLGKYNPALYKPMVVLNRKQDIVPGLMAALSADSMYKFVLKLGTFHNRNTGADTVSNQTGIGAARRWAYSKFKQFSARNENRLLPGYLQFNQAICSVNQHRNIMAVLPGIDTTDKSIVIIEGHIDSRCEGLCDITCKAQGMEDNATGTALVLELARVMSKYAYQNTIVFLITIAEEQGLYGANAFATYTKNKNIGIKAVLNNDVIGGVLCGKTASPPTDCRQEGETDSTHVRIFSAGGYTSTCKAFARFAKLEYIEEVLPLNPAVPMTINIMAPEDRTGRGGDHIPFRQNGYAAVRFTASHEHGDASNGTGYTDRQHTSRDTLGVDRNKDGLIDSFFVNFNYLNRNAKINGAVAAMAAIGPVMPSFKLLNDSASGLSVQLISQLPYKTYKVNVRRNATNFDLDRIYTFPNNTVFQIPGIKKDSTYFVSIAAIDSNDVESIFTIEQMAKSKSGVTSIESISAADIELNASPNPSSNTTHFSIKAPVGISGTAYLLITNILGQTITQLPLDLSNGTAETNYQHEGIIAGNYTCTLYINGKILLSKGLAWE